MELARVKVNEQFWEGDLRMKALMANNKRTRLIAVLLLVFTLVLSTVPLASAQRRRHRSFWHKHRDKITVVGSAVGGAALGGIIGGKKGALIGAGAGAGTGALYTYKLRKRH